ncbi:MAG TPA: hypothetical protein VHA55_04170 [Pseudorhodoplanes sp.]|jgi:hypothetical protein|nr:hypothetical protein [Pseudorhodoplanes sp.]
MAKRRRSSSPPRRSSSSSAAAFRLNAPTEVLFIVSIAIAAFAVIAELVRIPNVSAYSFWIGILSFVVLALGCVLKGL